MTQHSDAGEATIFDKNKQKVLLILMLDFILL